MRVEDPERIALRKEVQGKYLNDVHFIFHITCKSG
jgi:hypothetical protein